MTRRQLVAAWIVLGGAALALALYLLGRFERVEEEIRADAYGEARANRLLAAERLLARTGFRVRAVERLEALPHPGPGVVLVLAESERRLGEEQMRELVTWVASGGRLVVSPTREAIDPLFGILGIEIVKRPGAVWPLTMPRSKTSIPARSGEGGPFAATFREDIRLRPVVRASGRRSRAAGEPAAVVEIPMMKGVVIAASDLDFIGNERIGDLDHARLLCDLVGEPGREVWLVREGESFSLASLFLSRGWTLLLPIGLLALAWLARRGARFGPLLPAPARGSRALLEHVEAAGAFLWRRGLHDDLLGGVRAALARTSVQRRPFDAGLTAAERSTRLAAASGLPRRDILQALAGPCPGDADGFTRTVRTLETLRRAM